jgi:O-antigen/teichoic acid export membrane protein
MVGPKFLEQETQILQILAVIYALGSFCATAGGFGIGLGRPGLLSRWSLAGGALMCITMRLGGKWYGLPGAAWANASFLVVAFITLEILPVIGIRHTEAIRAFAPFVFATLFCWAFSATPAYTQLPVWGKLIVFCILEPLLFLATVGWSAIKDLYMKSLPGLRLAMPGKQS